MTGAQRSRENCNQQKGQTKAVIMPHVETKNEEGADPMALADKCIRHRGCGWGEQEHILGCMQETGHLRVMTKA